MDRIVSEFPRIWADLRFRPHTGKYGYDFVYKRENTDQRKPVYCRILRAAFL